MDLALAAINALIAAQRSHQEQEKPTETPQSSHEKENAADATMVTVCGLTLPVDATELCLFDRGICELTEADVAAIARLTRLQLVDFMGNRLTSLPAHLFAHNALLREVRLNINELTSLPEQLFAHNPRLECVLLSHNELSTLPADLLAHNPALEAIDFFWNPELKRVPIAWYRHWSAWTSSSRRQHGRPEVARAVAKNPELLALALEVPVLCDCVTASARH